MSAGLPGGGAATIGPRRPGAAIAPVQGSSAAEGRAAGSWQRDRGSGIVIGFDPLSARRSAVPPPQSRVPESRVIARDRSAYRRPAVAPGSRSADRRACTVRHQRDPQARPADALPAGACRWRRDWRGRRGVPRPDRLRAQPDVSWPSIVCLQLQHLHANQPLGAVRDPGAGVRRHRRHLHRQHLRARGARPRRPGGDGRHLLRPRNIRPVVAVAKSLASALSIGSGAAVGREGPIIQIGSSLGSTFGQVIRMAMGQRIILVAAGAGAGIAATFNTPIGGVMFAIELMLPEISVHTFLPVALATGTATFIGRLFFGLRPAFTVPAAWSRCRPRSAARSFCCFTQCWERWPASRRPASSGGCAGPRTSSSEIRRPYLRHIVGMLAVGALVYGC